MGGGAETKYAISGDLHIAYQVVGNGPIDLVFPPSGFSNVDALWDWPEAERFINRLTSFSRLIIFDQRGSGMSDPIPLADPPTLEERMDDIGAVMDAAGSDRAAILGSGNGSPLAALFAAVHPERATALVLLNATARRLRAPGYPFGLDPQAIAVSVDIVLSMWGRPEEQQRRYDDRTRRLMAIYQRAAASPATAAAIFRMSLAVDIRDALPSIRVPTLVIQQGAANPEEQREVIASPTLDESRYVADHIPGARLVELPGNEMLWMNLADEGLDEIEEFLTGVRPIAAPSRVLATVLFTDIVQSTERAAGSGDRKWIDTLRAHDAAVGRQIHRHQGRLLKTDGDGVLATFDGPARGVRCALSIRDAVRNLGIDVRAGLHTGEVELLGDDIGGIAVHIGKRVSGLAGPGDVLVSSTVKDLVVGSGIEFEDHGHHVLKGIPDEWRIFSVRG